MKHAEAGGSLLLRASGLWRHVAAVSAAALAVGVAALSVAPGATAAEPAHGGFSIDGVPPSGAYDDPVGSVDELGVQQSPNLKLNQLQDDALPTLSASDPNNSTDLSGVWLDTSVDQDDGDIWLYFAFSRENATGNSVVMFEFQQNGPPSACDYTSDATLIATCNPWAERTAGDFVVVWSMAGGADGIGIRYWEVDADGDWSLSPFVALAPSADLAFSDPTARTFGEAAINLSTYLFKTVSSCTTVANIVPVTLTSNSDQADVKDAVVRDFSDIYISSCGQLEVTKQTLPAGGTGEFGVVLDQADGGRINYGATPRYQLGATLVDDGGSDTWTEIRAGSDYRITEPTVPGSYVLDDVTCGLVDKGVVGPRTSVLGSTFEIKGGESWDCVVTNFLPTPGIHVEKDADKTTGVAAGDGVTFTMDVSWAAGANVDLTSIRLEDDTCSPLTGPVKTGGDQDETLERDETWTWSCVYTATQDDVDAGGGTNVATAYGTYAGNEVDDDDDATFTAATGASVDVEKDVVSTSGAVGGYAVGESVDYEMTIENTGVVTLTSVGMADPLCDTDPAYDRGDTDGDSTLDVGETWIYTCSRTVTQDDVDAGGLTNTATGSALPPSGSRVTADDTADFTTISSADLTLDKVATTTAPAPKTLATLVAGDPVKYTVTAANTGTVSLTDVVVTDPLCPGPGAPVLTYFSGDTAADDVMSPGESWVYTCEYTVSQEDVDAGPTLGNTATAVAAAPAAATLVGPVEDGRLKRTDTATIGFDRRASLAVLKLGSKTTAVLDEEVDYDVTVTNTGTVTLTDLEVADSLAPDCVLVDSTPDTALSPGESQVFECTYEIDQDDVDAGGVTNTATASALPPGATADEDRVSADDDFVVTIARKPSIHLDKSATPTSGVPEGGTVTYTFLVDNDGNTSLTDVGVDDPLCATVVLQSGDTDLDSVLDVDESWTFTCAYTVTAADVAAGSVVNIAVASGTPPVGDAVTSEDTATVGVFVPAPEIVVEKAGVLGGSSAAGQPVFYTVTVQNTGNVTVADLTATDPKCALAYQTGDTDQDGDLQVGETWTFTCTYPLTAADLDAEKVDNTASAQGTYAGGPVTDTDSATVELDAAPAIVVDKTAAPASGLEVGDEVVYTVVLTNGGNVTLSDVVLEDPLCAPVLRSGDANSDGRLQVTETWTYTCTYAVTQADVDRGAIENTATATAAFGSAVVEDDDTAVVPVSQVPGLTITKTPSPDSYDAVGDVIAYTYVVRNSGTTTLAGPFTVTDDKTAVTCPATASLAVGATVTCTASYVVTQADLDAGSVVNVARATNGTVTSPPVTARVERTEVLAVAPTPTPTPTPTQTSAPVTLPFADTPRALPFTGAVLLPVLAIGSGAMLIGALLVGAARSRRPQES